MLSKLVRLIVFSLLPFQPVAIAQSQIYSQPYAFSQDWFTDNIPLWREILAPYVNTPNLRYLEIGVFEGRSVLWMLENVLTHPSAQVVGIDLFPGDLRSRFLSNLELSGFANKVTTLTGKSQTVLKTFEPESFDIIYIDGSHVAADVLTDAVLSWQLLKPGGLLIFDDYARNDSLPAELSPAIAIDTFLTTQRNDLEIVKRGWRQIAVTKKTSLCSAINHCSSVGDYAYLFQTKELRAASNHSVVALTREETGLLERLLISRPFGETRLVIDRGKLQNTDLISLSRKLGVRIHPVDISSRERFRDLEKSILRRIWVTIQAFWGRVIEHGGIL